MKIFNHHPSVDKRRGFFSPCQVIKKVVIWSKVSIKLRSKMPEPKKQSSPRKTGLRRSHIRLELARRVNKTSPVKVFETKKKTPNLKVKTIKKKEA